MLVYHRIAELASDPQCLGVSPARFADHLDVIGERGVPMSLEALVSGARQGGLPAGAVAVTLDDGYADTLHGAAPLLARRQVPATVFVATGALARGREFWWDELERLLLRPGTLPARLCLPVGGEVAEWDLSGVEELTDDDCARHASWTVERAAPPTPRHRVYQDLCRHLRRLPGDVRDRTLDDLSVLARMPRDARATHRPLSAAEVAALARADDITVGSHTESHPSLASLPPAEQRREIASARRLLEEWTGAPVTSFAYPFGGSLDVSDCTTAMAQQAGITIACSTQPGSVRQDTSPHAVPRLVVRNWTRAEFLRRWHGWTAA